MSLELRVVILTYGTGAVHEPLLESLAAEGVDGERILIVHNPSTPGEQPPPAVGGCEVVTASHNLGYAAGMNLGIRRQLARECDLMLVLTHDARFHPGALRRLVDAAAAHPEYGVLGPVLVLTDSGKPFSYGGYSSEVGNVDHHPEPVRVDDGVAPCEWVDGGTMLIRAEALRKVGGFEERFWGYLEDAELCLRVSRAGYGVGVVVDALADQEPGMAKRLAPWSYLMTRNRIAYARRYAGRRAQALVSWYCLTGIGRDLTRAGARRLHLRPGPAADPYRIAIGTVHGLADAYRGRWGPPPAGLPGGGDISNVEPPQETAVGG